MVYLPRNEATWAITIQLCEDEIAEFLTKKDKEYLPQLSPALLGSIMIWAAGLSQLLPHYSLFYGQLWTPSKSFLGKYSFRDPNIPSYQIVLIPQISKMCHPLLAILWKL